MIFGYAGVRLAGPQIVRYFNRGFYNRRWSLTGDVDRPWRVPAPQKGIR